MDGRNYMDGNREVEMMIGKQIQKENLDLNAYSQAASWCNVNRAVIEDKGEYYEVVAIPEQTLEDRKAAKLSEIKSQTAAAITGGFLSNGVRYDSDMDTQVTMQGICLAVDTQRFAEEYSQGCPVRGYDLGSEGKTIHYLDAEGVKQFCADLSAHIGECKKRGWQLQQMVANVTTKEELDAIIWE